MRNASCDAGNKTAAGATHNTRLGSVFRFEQLMPRCVNGFGALEIES